MWDFFLLWIVALKLVLWPVDGRGELVVTVIRLVQFLDGVDNVSIDQTDCRQDGFVRKSAGPRTEVYACIYSLYV